MKKVTMFYLKSCPHCKNAEAILHNLCEENPLYSQVAIERIEERENPQIADKYDYYYVPCYYVEGEKCHEGVPTTEKIEAVLKKALEE